MAKLVLDDITSGYASIATLNDNFTAIEEAIENTVSRDGTSPNTLSADLDMNGNALLNVGDITVNGYSLADLAADAEAAAASAAAALISETNAAASEDAAALVAGELVDLEYMGAWTDATLYKVNNIVYYSTDGGSYICTVEHTSSGTLDAAKFGKLADKGAAGAGTGDMLKAENLSGLANYTTARANLSLTPGTNVQAYSANLDTFSTKTFIDEDDMVSNLNTALPSQQSVKAYVDGKLGAATTTTSGLVELATTAEAATRTDTSRAVTPEGLGTVVRTTTTFTPSFKTFTIGNGTVLGKYAISGNIVTIQVAITLGTTSSVGAQGFDLEIPAGLSNPATSVAGTMFMWDSTASAYRGGTFLMHSLPVVGWAAWKNVSDATGAQITATSPWTWATGDLIYMSFSYVF